MRQAFTSFLIIIIAAISYSQTKTYVGVRAGVHGKSVFLDHTIFNFVMREVTTSGSNIGVLIKHFPKKKDIVFNSGIQIGVNYSQKGWVQSFESEREDARVLPNYRVNMNYLEIPIEGIGYFGNKNKYFIAAGFLLEFLIDHSTNEAPPFDTDDLSDGVLRINNWNFATYEPDRDRQVGYGGRLSGGVFRDFSFGSLQVEGYFTYSFSSFIAAGDLTNPNVPDISNLWTFGVSVAYLIPFGKLDMIK